MRSSMIERRLFLIGASSLTLSACGKDLLGPPEAGAIYPVKAFPNWLKVIAWIDPFTYAVHGFKALLLKEAGLAAIWGDIMYLAIFTLLMMTGVTLLFKRTL